MRRWLGRAAFALAALLLVMTFFNASWLAPSPAGVIKLVAPHGVAQLATTGSAAPCPAATDPPVHDYSEGTRRSLDAARRLGTDMIGLRPTAAANGRLLAFPPCPGQPSPASLAEALATLPATAILFQLTSNDPAEADRLAAALAAAGRDVIARRDAFSGPPRAIDRIHLLYPAAWSWSPAAAARCASAYRLTGWTGIIPAACRNGTLIVTLDHQWRLWGWPNRLLARMARGHAHVIVAAATNADGSLKGLDRPEQLGEVPSTFKGWIWVDDPWTVAPALYPDRDFRDEAQVKAAQAGLARRAASR